MTDALEKLCKWRTILAGWHHGTGATDKPGVQAMRDLAEKWLIMRTENNALAQLMIDKGVFTAAEYRKQMEQQAAHLDKMMEQRFPGFKTFDGGVHIYDVQLAQQTTKRLGFPP